MKRHNIRTQFDPTYKGSKGEINNLPSQTVPDMSLTVSELLQNHARGITNSVNTNEGQFFDTEIPKHDDITDVIEHKQSLKDSLT